MITAQYLYERFGDADEGALSRLRASIVSGDSLAQLAAGAALGDLLALGQGELKTGGFRRESILADALEALCGALYLDGGLDAARAAMLRAAGARRCSRSGCRRELKDPKTRLQELLQARGLPLPRYSVDSVERRIARAGVSRNLRSRADGGARQGRRLEPAARRAGRRRERTRADQAVT